jgi:hypothetical protein
MSEEKKKQMLLEFLNSLDQDEAAAVREMLYQFLIQVYTIKYKIIIDILTTSSEDNIKKKDLIKFILEYKYTNTFIHEINKKYNLKLKQTDYENLGQLEIGGFDVMRLPSKTGEVLICGNCGGHPCKCIEVSKTGYKDLDRINITGTTSSSDQKMAKNILHQSTKVNQKHKSNLKLLDEMARHFIRENFKINSTDTKKFLEECMSHSINLKTEYVPYIFRLINHDVPFEHIDMYLLGKGHKLMSNEGSESFYKLNNDFSTYYNNELFYKNYAFVNKYMKNYEYDTMTHYDLTKLYKDISSNYNSTLAINMKKNIDSLFQEDYGYNSAYYSLLKKINEEIAPYGKLIKADKNNVVPKRT